MEKASNCKDRKINNKVLILARSCSKKTVHKYQCLTGNDKIVRPAEALLRVRTSKINVKKKHSLPPMTVLMDKSLINDDEK